MPVSARTIIINHFVFTYEETFRTIEIDILLLNIRQVIYFEAIRTLLKIIKVPIACIFI